MAGRFTTKRFNDSTTKEFARTTQISKGKLFQVKISAFLTCFAIVFLSVKAFGFDVPETLRYDLSLAGFTIGHLTLEAKDVDSDLRLETSMSTLPWVSLFYKVDDHAVSVLQRSPQKDFSQNFTYLPRTYEAKFSEGPHKADVKVAFDNTKKIIICMDLLNEDTTVYKQEGFTLDPLATLYYMRQVPLTPGESVFIHVFNNKLVRDIEVQVKKRETIKTIAGTVDTVPVRADMYFDGVGVMYYPGDVTVWLTDDEKRIPVVIEKKLNDLAKGKLPAFVLRNMPEFLKEKLFSSSLKATLVP